MKINIVSCVYHPEPIVSARTSKELADALSARGHSVQVITTFPNRPAGKLYKGYRHKIWMHERSSGGYEILRVFSFFSSQSSLLSRFLENFSFGFSSGLATMFLEKPDVIYGNTWPIFGQGLLMLVCKFRHIPLVLSIQDLYPESLYVQNRGVEKKSRLYSLLHWLDTQIARNCRNLIVISEQFKQIYLKDRHVPENKISVIPNWIGDSIPAAASEIEIIRAQHDIPPDAFLVVYGGNIGAAAGVEHLIEAFYHLLPQENIYLLLAGAGGSLQNCLDLIQKYQLERVKIRSPWQISDTYAVLGTADLCILLTQGEQSLVSVPSKLLSYMMAACCVLAVASSASETARVITDSRSGWVISTNDSKSLANCIDEISRLSIDERNRRGQAGRSFVLKNFSTREYLSKAVELIAQHGKHSE